MCPEILLTSKLFEFSLPLILALVFIPTLILTLLLLLLILFIPVLSALIHLPLLILLKTVLFKLFKSISSLVCSSENMNKGLSIEFLL